MNPRVEKIVRTFKKELLEKLDGHIIKTILFGSYARGEEEPDSDVDMLIIADDKNRNLEKSIGDIAYKIMWDNDFNPLLSIMVVSEVEFKKFYNLGYSFYENVEKEGILL